ncbi:MAG: hypothetical protein JWP21_3001 [Tardiphaga sp.]|nr:hypothetical protein [Tardiphaga sp.]
MTSTVLYRVLIALTGLMGAAGVALAAAAAHQGDASRLAPASSMLLFHAPAVLVTILLAVRRVIQLSLGLVAAFSFVVGAGLFAGDLSMRVYLDHALFPMAAPTGGSLLIVSWLVLAVAALWPRRG